MHEIHDILQQLAKEDQRYWLATIIDVEGSSYRKKGAMMLLAEDGTSIGILSGGCVEIDIKERLPFITAPEKITYDLQSENEEMWGRGAGCNGKITILLEPVSQQLRTDLLKIKTYLDNGKSVTCKRVEKEYVFTVEHHIIGSEELIGLAGYEQIFTPKPRVIIFGAGDDAIPLCEFANHVGFATTVCDHREDYCTPSRFPKADALIIGLPNSTIPRLLLGIDDYIVVMTHMFQLDQEIVRNIPSESVAYLGFLGPRRRTERLYGGEIPENISAPVGLSIHAQGAAEIAISIIAELIYAYRKRV